VGFLGFKGFAPDGALFSLKLFFEGFLEIVEAVHAELVLAGDTLDGLVKHHETDDAGDHGQLRLHQLRVAYFVGGDKQALALPE
jgi:hypothetical protein